MEEEEEGERGKGIGGGEEKDLEGVLLRRTPSGEEGEEKDDEDEDEEQSMR